VNQTLSLKLGRKTIFVVENVSNVTKNLQWTECIQLLRFEKFCSVGAVWRRYNVWEIWRAGVDSLRYGYNSHFHPLLLSAEGFKVGWKHLCGWVSWNFQPRKISYFHVCRQKECSITFQSTCICVIFYKSNWVKLFFFWKYLTFWGYFLRQRVNNIIRFIHFSVNWKFQNFAHRCVLSWSLLL
jgi:hypothetical protein